MSLFKCKICGGSLEILDGSTVVQCEYCGTKQTLPRLSDERITNLYDRANHFRRNNDYDKALSIYEQILSEDRSDSEAYWSILLCRYGIEYVEDPVTRRRIPTINRAQYTSILSDEDYKSAILYADDAQKEIYEQEAKEIDEIQKRILEVSQSEEPFDIFICYKETDVNGRRTPDSVLATELYNELSREGYKVFFSRITLEDKLGQEYEPIIFAALNTAKVMVVLGTKPEHFNAVWVKNEWIRYLFLIRNGEKKTLIPAYRDMDPYDLPEEFSHLQAQDMSKLGFMQDLIHGIKKIISANKSAEGKDSHSNGNTGIESSIDYALILIEDGDPQKAQQILEQVVSIAPKHPMIYVAKLLIECGIKHQEDLAHLENAFDQSPNYQKAVRFANPQLKATLEGYANNVKENSVKSIYERATTLMDTSINEMGFLSAKNLFDSIREYSDAAQLSAVCAEKAEAARKEAEYLYCKDIYDSAVQKMNSNSTKEVDAAKQLFDSIADFEDSKQLSDFCKTKVENARKEAIYQNSLKLMHYNTSDRIPLLKKAIEGFTSIKSFKDAEVLIDKCERLIYAENEARAKKIKKRKIITLITTILVVVVISFAFIFFTVILPKNRYNKAEELFAAQDYVAAFEAYDKLGDYEDAADKAKECLYIQATSLRAEEKWDDANAIFEKIKDYKDSASLIHNHTYEIISSEDPTCVTAGYIEHKCKDCEYAYTSEIKPTGSHNYKVTNSKNATCESGGFKDYKCTDCGYSYREEVKAKGHNYSSATCTAPKKCKTCGKVSGNALGHTNDGVKCSRCGTVLFTTQTYTGVGSKVIDYSVPKGKFEITVTMTSGDGSVQAKVHYTTSYGFDSYKSFYIYNKGDSEVDYIEGPMKGSIVINASSTYSGESGWKLTIEAV